ncbi:MAG: hypothetical protein LBN26_00295 [Christensenellaceae bacterium]|jgi:hypothetical protein|nr:hypothetical protein [Christensenellaceae bacterium]
MKEYKLIYLNKGLKLSREKDLTQSEDVLNQYIAEGWTLQQIVSPGDGIGALVAVVYKEKVI